MNQKIKNYLSLEDVIKLIPGHVYWKDLNCRFLGCNDAQARIAGLDSRHEIVGKSSLDVISKNQPEHLRLQQAEAIDKIDKRIMRTGIPETIEEPLILEEGTERIFLSQKVAVRDKNDNVIGLLGISVDITDKKEAEALKTKQALNVLIDDKRWVEITLRKIISLLPAHVYWKDRKGIFLGCNLLQAKSLNLQSEEEFVGKTDYDLFPKEQADKIVAIDQEIIKTGKPHSVEEVASTADGQTKFYLSQKVPLNNENNETIGLVGISVDITDKKAAEALKAKQVLMEAAAQVSHTSIIIAHSSFKYSKLK